MDLGSSFLRDTPHLINIHQVYMKLISKLDPLFLP